ncbi:LacI family DNA-binding transcriptional regulator [Croceivirga sp. JEA036]|uniref:LacI family DNA-binding transcriptional regulator n=1 Tax=Croceivirga sp. JEA036 TaxID=2721162 RepID=UPI00143C861E|nr:LacI family DNA-binding transcriptional regulator [Croceivirga sp. JEA036]NJB38019.1 LacI family transcriptional regulator [Croceivirga sp. JEA036]
MKKFTLKDIAKHFSVSVSTASKAINDSHEISEELKQRIQHYAKANNYRPNRIALSLLKKNTKTLGVVVPSILNYFFAQVFSGIEKAANARGYNIISCTSDESFVKEQRTLELFSTGTVDGLILSLAEETQSKEDYEHVRNFMSYQIPLVMFDRVCDEIQCDKVVVDDEEAGFNIAEYLFDTGCKNIAIVSSISNSSVGKLRITGFKKSLAQRGLVYEDKLNVKVGKEDDLQLLLTLLLASKEVDGIIALDEMTAVDVLNICKQKKIKVPEELAIVGFTNGKLSKYVSPSLTMVSQHGKYIGETSANMLIDRIEQVDKELPYTTKLVKTSIIPRESTLPLPE